MSAAESVATYAHQLALAADGPPLRGELFGIERLKSHAAQLASSLSMDERPTVDDRFYRRFHRNAEFLQSAYRAIAAAIRQGDPLTPDAEWLLDNFYVVEEHLREIRDDLPQGYFRELPKLRGGDPRIYQLALELIVHTDSAMDQEAVTAFVNQFQIAMPLTIGEVWAIPIMLRMALVENLSRLAAQMLGNRQCRSTARRVLETWQAGDPLPQPLDRQDISPVLVVQCIAVAGELFPEDTTRGAALEQLLAERFPTAADMVREEHRRQAVNQVSIGNVITSMRLISALDWVTFFEQTSLAEQVLHRDPAGVYAGMDLATRDRYRHAVEDLAKRSKHTDLYVAERAVQWAESARASVGAPDFHSHVGYWLIDDGRAALERELRYRPSLRKRIDRALLAHPYVAYLGSIAALTLLGMFAIAAIAFAATASAGIAALMALLGMLPLTEFAVNFVNLAITHRLRPKPLPKLELKAGVPQELRTMVVVPALLTGHKEVASLLQRLELHCVANAEPQLCFALLTDFTDAATEHVDGDDALVEQAVNGIRRLNARYGSEGRNPFYLFHRARRWNDRERVWMGWERKRGKLMEFNRLLHGDRTTSYVVQEGDAIAAFGDASRSPAFQFVITLDADTQLPLGAARRLIGTLAHPLNRPQLSADGRKVLHGYTILQPRVSVLLADGNRSWFSRIFANSRGIDPYATAASDVYQDLFGEGSFTGKGIYDLEAFEETLAGAFAENQILSHDLIEGCHSRVGLVSDIEVIDGYPSQYNADARRLHRWARGDWQILPWLFHTTPCETGRRPNRLSVLSRWKILDNLRRSLVPPATCAFLIAGWLLAPGAAVWWSIVALVCIGVPTVVGLCALLIELPRVESWRIYLRNVSADVFRSITQTLIIAACLPHKAILMLDAIARTLVRMGITRRRMLEWETAAATERRLTKSRWSAVTHMWYVPVIAAAVAWVLPLQAWPAAAPWLAGWFLSPAIAEWISRPWRFRREELAAEDRQWLRNIARNTWSYFESCVGPKTHWLPPDNLQEYPQEKLAERISPTNEGLFLVSALVARDFGFVGLHAVTELWERNLATWTRFPRLRGHFYNWYDTATLQPLLPRYVSTVDSGNLAASLIAVGQGVEDVCTAPVFGPALWEGLRDTLAVAIRACDDLQPRGAHMVSPPLDNLAGAIAQLREALPESPTNWSERVAVLRLLRESRRTLTDQLREFVSSHRHPIATVEEKFHSLFLWIDAVDADFRQLCPWAEMLADVQQAPERFAAETHRDAWQRLQGKLEDSRSVNQLAALPEILRPELSALTVDVADPNIEAFISAIDAAAQAAVRLKDRLTHLGVECERLALEMDFQFLFNPQRRLFAIGFNLEDGVLDRAHYDMLCSEARISSHLAIAKGDVASRHWFQLGRQLTYTAGRPGLLSWGGSMFEFLMPLLFQRRFEGSLLSRACEVAVARQQEYGRQCGIPWGVSESAYAALAANSDHHYQSFGVPGLGLKRGLSDDLVVAPYATMLALAIDPVASVANLRRLVEEEGLGRWGFYDAVDYTPVRLPAGRRSLPVRCYMAHHQAMSLIAIANLLFDQVIERRFHAHPLVRATELLLQEAMPAAAPIIQPHVDETAEVRTARPEEQMVSRRLSGYETPSPRTHLLSNGAYSVMVTNTGGGYSVWGDLAVTRWRPDVACDHGGHCFYIRDRQSERTWSPTYYPTCQHPESYEIVFSIDKAEYRRRDGDLETHLEITVCPDSQVELRQIKITNHGWQPRVLEVTSYAEVVLATPAADLAHPAFQKLFVETEYIPEEAALLARRRPRESHQPPLWGLHVVSCPEMLDESVQYDTSRQQFLGRGRTPRAPAAMEPGVRLSGTTGSVLDSVFALRCAVSVAPHASVSIAFATGIAESREVALRLADEFHEQRSVQRAFELAWAFNQVKLHHLHLTAARAQRFQQFAAYLLFPHPKARGNAEAILANRQGQSGLWRFGISGDRPILLVKIADPDQVEFVRELLTAREYWDGHGLKVDLVILNTHPGSYLDVLQEQLQRIIQEAPRKASEVKNAVFLLRGSQIAREDQVLLEAVAHVVLDGRRGWASVLQPAVKVKPPLTKSPETRTTRPAEILEREVVVAPKVNGAPSIPKMASPTVDGLEFWNGLGGFANDGREYRVRLTASAPTPMPWSNIIANPRFGTLVTESGGGYTWAGNSRENKLTTWANDPVADPPSEMLFLRDEGSHQLWMPLARPRHARDETWVHHGQGYTRVICSRHELDVETLIAVADDDPVKFVCVKVRNRSRMTRHLSATYYAELVLGVCREQTQMHVVTAIDETTGALVARNAYHPEFPDQVAFLQVIATNRSCVGDRVDFLGRNGERDHPAALQRPRLSGRVGAGLDPCGAIQCQLTIAAGETVEVAFLLGCGADSGETQRLLARYHSLESVQSAVRQTIDRWDAILTSIQVETPNRALDLLVNRWLIYQTLSCRVWGRSAYYQASGAYGFRDQLQDVLALVYCRPDFVREHLLRAAAHQYDSGDVQHWWHPPLGRGTRTKFSDDLLWLPFAAAHYIRVTGDEGVLDETATYLHSPPLAPDEQERYEYPQASGESGSLYDHCLRALERGFRIGDHGLPLMGSGDWNDGMNLVGAGGRGESVWVGWFLLVVLDHWLPLMERRGDDSQANQYRQRALALRAALEQHAWDGEWYRRAFFDDGTPLGSRQNDECQIDSIAQSWAVLANADEARTDQAIDAVFERLVFPADRLVALFAPPFDQTSLDPGYIKGYVPGIRENGGQYTHAVLWLIQALAKKGDANRAGAVFDLINPIRHADTPQGVRTYQTEPYVVAGDVYAVPPHAGRGGWTWYTGSAAWMYRIALESILGLDIRHGRVSFAPCVPDDWNEFKVTVRVGSSVWRFVIQIHEGSGISADEQPLEVADDGGEHEVTIRIGKPATVRRERDVPLATAG